MSGAIRLAQARARISELADLHAFISLSSEQFDGARDGPIVAVKDLIDVRGLPTTGGSLAGGRERGGGSGAADAGAGSAGAGSPASTDAPVVANVRRAGGVVIGKTNLYEWAFGVSGHNSHYGDVVNPRDRQRTAGGSSGGSAVAVATGMCDWAIGTDTGGSIRIPASLCGVVGFKPTRGLVSTRGVLPLSGSLDTVGPLARDVLGAVGALETLSGQSFGAIEPAGLPLRLAVPRGWVLESELDAPTRAVWSRLARSLPEVEFPELGRLSAAASTVLEWEAVALHEPALRQGAAGYGREVRERLEGAMRRRSAEAYAEALVEMSELGAQVESALDGLDAVLLPASACVAPSLSAGQSREPLVRFMRPFNLTGHPAIVLPAPVDGLPVGVQLVGALTDDARLAAVALAFERAWKSVPPRPPV